MMTPMLENNSVKFNFDINILKELYKKSNDVIVLLKQNGDINAKMMGKFSINPELYKQNKMGRTKS